MAVPKKRTPKSRRNARRSNWFQDAFKKAKQALAFSKVWTLRTGSTNEESSIEKP